MATLVNIRIHTQAKAVHDADYVTIDKVTIEGNTIVAEGGNVRYVLGVVPMENIVVETPSNSTECGCNTTNANIFATLIKGVDGVTPDMSDYYNKKVIDEKLATKQDVVRDIETIRDGANKGATALQPSDVDSEPSETSTNPIQNKTFTGALNDVFEAMETAFGAFGDRLNTKQDKLVSGENIKTINGESIVGEGNIEIEGGTADLEGYATEEYVNNAIKAAITDSLTTEV